MGTPILLDVEITPVTCFSGSCNQQFLTHDFPLAFVIIGVFVVARDWRDVVLIAAVATAVLFSTAILLGVWQLPLDRPVDAIGMFLMFNAMFLSFAIALFALKRMIIWALGRLHSRA